MSSISAGLSQGTALVSTGDTTGELVLKTNGGTTAVTIGTDQSVTLAAGLTTASPTVFPAGTASLPAITTTGDTNTGIYFPGADRIGFAEGGTQVGEFDASGNFQFNSGYGSVATAYGCRAWVNFNGTSTVAIRASGNVSSITDNGTGDYTVNFTTAMPDANFCVCCAVSNTVNSDYGNAGVFTTGGATVKSFQTNGSFVDVTIMSVAVFR